MVSDVSPGDLPVTRICVGPMAETSAMSGLPTETRLYVPAICSTADFWLVRASAPLASRPLAIIGCAGPVAGRGCCAIDDVASAKTVTATTTKVMRWVIKLPPVEVMEGAAGFYHGARAARTLAQNLA